MEAKSIKEKRLMWCCNPKMIIKLLPYIDQSAFSVTRPQLLSVAMAWSYHRINQFGWLDPVGWTTCLGLMTSSGCDRSKAQPLNSSGVDKITVWGPSYIGPRAVEFHLLTQTEFLNWVNWVCYTCRHILQHSAMDFLHSNSQSLHLSH